MYMNGGSLVITKDKTLGLKDRSRKGRGTMDEGDPPSILRRDPPSYKLRRDMHGGTGGARGAIYRELGPAVWPAHK